MKKINVGILFGGKSTEHEVSLQSAKNIIESIDRDKYDITLIGIDKKGAWRLNDAARFLLHSGDPQRIALAESAKPIVFDPGSGQFISGGGALNIDVVLPVLHGPCGEDGTVQGLLTLAGVPFVGAGVLGSAIGMDKDVMKRLLRDAGLPVVDFCPVNRDEADDLVFSRVAQRFGLPVFVKPANAGSSVGVSKARTQEEFDRAVKDAFAFDNKILLEKAVPQARELECAVLGNERPAASGVGEVILHADFYSYAAKYIDQDGATVRIAADLPQDTLEQVQKLAVRTFVALCCEGMARVDFFLDKEGKLWVNEINTIPGFTNISMYPQLWAKEGITCGELIHRLIQLAIERHDRQSGLKTQCEVV